MMIIEGFWNFPLSFGYILFSADSSWRWLCEFKMNYGCDWNASGWGIETDEHDAKKVMLKREEWRSWILKKVILKREEEDERRWGIQDVCYASVTSFSLIFFSVRFCYLLFLLLIPWVYYEFSFELRWMKRIRRSLLRFSFFREYISCSFLMNFLFLFLWFTDTTFVWSAGRPVLNYARAFFFFICRVEAGLKDGLAWTCFSLLFLY